MSQLIDQIALDALKRALVATGNLGMCEVILPDGDGSVDVDLDLLRDLIAA